VADKERVTRAPSRPDGAAAAPSRRAALAVLAWWAWAMAEVSVVLFVVYRHRFSPWGLVGAQVLAYAVLVAPVVALRRPVQEPAGRRRRLAAAAAGAAVLLAAVLIVAAGHPAGYTARQVIRLTATGVGEEVLWRGAVWTSLARLGLRLPALVTADVILFVSWHVPSVLAGDSTWSGLPAVAALGLVFCLARAASRRVELPALLHIAADLLGT